MAKIKIVLLTAFLLAVILLSGCSDSANRKTIKIAVTGSSSVYSEYFEKGIKKAYENVCNEYKDSGYDIKLDFYDDMDNYEIGNKITAELIADDDLTAIIASSSPDICDDQIFQTDKAGKILVCPHWVYDKTLEEKNYKRVFCLNYSCSDTGLVMKRMAEYSPAKKWALCYSDDMISKDEIDCFFSLSDSDKINIVDSVKIDSLISDFDVTVERWKLLGVEGVVLIPYDDEGFELLYRLKSIMPNLYVVSDSSMDNSDAMLAHKDEFNNVYIVSKFNVDAAYSEGSEVIEEGEYYDTWEIHGYNAVRMIIDTAIKNDTVSCDEIAEILHKNGYSGDLERFKFQENGRAIYNEFYCDNSEKEEIVEYVIRTDNKKSGQDIANGKVEPYFHIPWD